MNPIQLVVKTGVEFCLLSLLISTLIVMITIAQSEILE